MLCKSVFQSCDRLTDYDAGRRSGTIDTQHLLAYLETLMLRILPLEFHHHKHDDHRDPQEPYSTLARHARMAAQQLQGVVSVVFKSWQADLAISGEGSFPVATLSAVLPTKLCLLSSPP
ncbi:hypothetical protein K4K59_004634 [Colletotrichum sp. SAR11_240]|nr:hypothetical protein K4K59_004634 [Colletotrichum sp. SAR11_240]